MSALKSILVHVDSSPQAAVRVAWAQQLAALHSASVAALYAVTSMFTRYPLALSAGGDFGPLLVETDNQRRADAHALFDKAGGPGAAAWLEGAGLPVGETVRHALYADLLLLGQRGVDDNRDVDVPPDFVSSVILDSGRPALVIPYIAKAPAPLRRVLVAWKENRESARAVSAALPLLQHAEDVRVVSFGEEDQGLGGAALPGAGPAAITTYLERHGVRARFDRQSNAGEPVGEQLLSLAADAACDLLVMGCYAHSRTRERVLGGVTRSVLEAMTLPVLMAH
jgi:nucleotide-binding universal stress UspA family protein